MTLTVDEEFANERFIEIAKKHDLNPEILREIMFYRNKGLNNGEIAEATGHNRNTVYKYLNALNAMSDEDLRTLLLILAIIGSGAFLLAFASLLIKPPGGQ